jgi:hypothetical protein
VRGDVYPCSVLYLLTACYLPAEQLRNQSSLLFTFSISHHCSFGIELLESPVVKMAADYKESNVYY